MEVVTVYSSLRITTFSSFLSSFLGLTYPSFNIHPHFHTPTNPTLFPQPTDCEPSLLLSSLNTDDSGTLNILPSLWSVPQDIISAAFGDASLNTQDVGSQIPFVGTGAIIGSAECKKRCGIQT